MALQLLFHACIFYCAYQAIEEGIIKVQKSDAEHSSYLPLWSSALEVSL